MSKSRLQAPESKLRHSAGVPVQARAGTGVGNRDMLSQLGASKSMPKPVQEKMEESLGADFSGVSLYESPLVAQGGAEAAAAGNAVAFAPGKLDFSSRPGLELLGHELSHVASQARGEVPGSGFVSDSALERKADADGARAAGAFDSLSGQTLSPMSGGMAMPSAAAPVQARKKKEEEQQQEPVPTKSRGDLFREDFDSRDLSGQVRLMADMARFISRTNDTDKSEVDVYFDLTENLSPEFMEEMLQQQAQASYNLNAVKGNQTGMGTDATTASYRAKYSEEADDLQAFISLSKDIGSNTFAGEIGSGAYKHYLQRAKELPAPMREAMSSAQNGIIQHTDRAWEDQNSDYFETLDEQMLERNQDFVERWNQSRNAMLPAPVAEPEPQRKKGIFSRLFSRRR